MSRLYYAQPCLFKKPPGVNKIAFSASGGWRVDITPIFPRVWWVHFCHLRKTASMNPVPAAARQTSSCFAVCASQAIYTVGFALPTCGCGCWPSTNCLVDWAGGRYLSKDFLASIFFFSMNSNSQQLLGLNVNQSKSIQGMRLQSGEAAGIHLCRDLKC